MSVTILESPSDIFASRAAAIVIPTNTLGIQGKGLALAAAKRWPIWNQEYRAHCMILSENLEISPGHVWPWLAPADTDGWAPIVYALATKDHWRNPSRLEWVRQGLLHLVVYCRAEELPSVAVPALGCGFGGLAWSDVLPVLERELAEAPDVDFRVYAPQPAPARPARPARSRSGGPRRRGSDDTR